MPQFSSCAASFPISSPGWKETDADLRGLLPEFLPSDERETHLARAIFLAGVLSLIVKSCHPVKGCVLPWIACSRDDKAWSGSANDGATVSCSRNCQVNGKLLPLRQVRSSFLSHASKELKIAAWHLAVAMNFCVVRGQEHEESKLQASV